MSSRIRLGMVGGGDDAFIGEVHRIASRIDDCFELVAGAFSSSPERSHSSGLKLGIRSDRIYDNFQKMAERESAIDCGIEAVSIVTPNHLHYEVACTFLKKGIHVICDKPLTSNLSDAENLVRVVEESSGLFMLTHNYTAYPMVRQAKEMVLNRKIGNVRLIQVEYPQEWLTEYNDSKQADWRTDPFRSGPGGCIGDIGTHAYNLACFITGLNLESLSADIHTFVPGRLVDDNAHVLLRFAGGAKGILWASQVAPGHENSLKIRIYGDKGGLQWSQEDPNYLWYSPLGESKRLITRNGSEAGERSQIVSRIPGGHPEGYLEAFATIYQEAAKIINENRICLQSVEESNLPSVYDGLRGMQFIDACIRSSKEDGSWIHLIN